jgi:uncharacterized protein involved in response to NO
MTTPRTRPDNLPAVFSYGFRPFFLMGATYGGLAILAWLPILYGSLETASLFHPVDWHVHELLFGYLAAIVTGFLLTAIPNWTGRLPVRGLPLALLALLWLAGRFAVFFSAQIGWRAAMAIDCAFLLVLAAAAANEIVAGRNWRNLKVLAPVTVLFAANVLFHLEAHLAGSADIGRRLGIAAAILLIMIIGGRIIPSFTRNWLVRENPGRLPVPFERFDAVTIVVSALALAGWTFAPDHAATGTMLLAAGALNLARLARWAGWRARRDTLVLILHVGYLFIPAGLLAAGIGALAPDLLSPVAGIHLFGAGAIGTMTLAVMTRASLGHTGRDLHADAATSLIYAAVVLAALTRFAAVLAPDQPTLLYVSAGCWTAAFLGYAARYGGMLVQPKLKPRQPNRAPA